MQLILNPGLDVRRNAAPRNRKAGVARRVLGTDQRLRDGVEVRVGLRRQAQRKISAPIRETAGAAKDQVAGAFVDKSVGLGVRIAD